MSLFSEEIEFRGTVKKFQGVARKVPGARNNDETDTH